MTAEEQAASQITPPRFRLGILSPWIARGLFEGTLIVFSVLIALAVSNWAEERKTAQRVAEMRGILLAPEILPHHDRLKTAFSAVGGYPGRPFHAELVRPALGALFESGMHAAPVRDVVWSSISGGDLLEHMEPEEVFLLAALYRQQANLEGLNRAGYQTIMPLVEILTDQSVAPQRMVQTTAYLEDLLAQERRLVSAYDEALTTLDQGAKQ